MDFSAKVNGQPAELEFVMEAMEGYKLYWVGCGDADFAYPGTKVMDEMLTRLDMPHTMFISGGGHTWSNWRYYLNTFPRLLFK